MRRNNILHLQVLNILSTRFFGLFWMSARIGESQSCSCRGHRTGMEWRHAKLFRHTCTYVLHTGERLSPWVSMACIAMAVTLLIQ